MREYLDLPKEVERKLEEIKWKSYFDEFKEYCLENGNYNYCHRAAMLLKDAKERELCKKILKENCLPSGAKERGGGEEEGPKIAFAGSCWTLACLLSEENNWSEALPFYKYACDVTRHPKACYNLGYAYRKGLTADGQKNAFLARKYFRIACLNYSHAKSCFSLGEMLLLEKPENLTPKEDDFEDLREISIKGRDEEVELPEEQKEIRAAQYFSIACDNNLPLACINAFSLFAKHSLFSQAFSVRFELERQRSHALLKHSLQRRNQQFFDFIKGDSVR